MPGERMQGIQNKCPVVFRICGNRRNPRIKTGSKTDTEFVELFALIPGTLIPVSIRLLFPSWLRAFVRNPIPSCKPDTSRFDSHTKARSHEVFEECPRCSRRDLGSLGL